VRRIVVIGPGGSGKSWLARELSGALGLSIIHLDSMFWQPGWVPRPQEEWEALQRRMAADEAWIVEGLHQRTVQVWLDAADTVIFLDVSPVTSIWRVARRRLDGDPGPDVPAGCDPAPFHVALRKFLAYMWEYHRESRSKLVAELARPRPGQRLIVLRRAGEMRRFVGTLPRATSSNGS
jgi:adenylate kinase family enzyme